MRIFRNASFVIAIMSSISVWAADQYLPYVDAYVGDYQGSFNGNKGTLRLAVVDNELTAEFYGEEGLVRNCDASIGALKDVDVDEDDGAYEIDSATFYFDAGDCNRKIEGREITFDFKHSKGAVTGVNLSVVEYTETRYDHNCYGGGGYPGYPGYPGGGYGYPGDPYGRCTTMPYTYANYLTGKFKR